MILAYDIGTTTVKGALFDIEGKLLEAARVPVRLRDTGDARSSECDPNSWINAIALLNPQLGVKRSSPIDAIVVSGNGPTVVPVDKIGKPADYAITWLDRRAIKEADIVSEKQGFKVDPSFFLPKVLWIRNKKAEVYEKTRYFLPCPEFIDFYLTGNAHAVLPSEGFARYMWTDDVVEALELDISKFPRPVKPGEEVGTLKREASEILGLPEGARVVAGGPDFIMSLLGTATVRPGRVCDRAGTSEGINLCSSRKTDDPRLLSLPHIVEGLYNISGIISTSGKALEWFKVISGKTDLDYETLFEDICLVPPGSEGLVFLPYLTGERSPIWNPHARGVFIGLSLKHGRKEMMRAVVESVGYAIRDVIEIMEEDGYEVEDLRVTGGQSRSPLWNQVKADITGKRILLSDCEDAELSGNAAVAMIAMGRYDNYVEASEAAFNIKKIFEPQRELKNLYDDLFEIYRESYRGLEDVFERLSRVSVKEGKWLQENQ